MLPRSKTEKEITDIFFLGAGKPKSGERPSALKEIGASRCALDWQLNSLEMLGKTKIHFLGGYHVEKVIQKYPNLYYTVIPDWEHKSILNTLFQAPLRSVPTLITYADTIFIKDDIYKVCKSKADVTLLYDSHWKQRYEKRRKDDLLSAEVISLLEGEYCSSSSEKRNDKLDVEFTGVVKFSPSVLKFISTIINNNIGNTLLDLIDYLYQQRFKIKVIDVKGNWTELNSPFDVSHFILGTKAETLSRLAPLLAKSCIGEQVSFATSDWRKNQNRITTRINKVFKEKNLIIRSSSKDEDNWSFSNAGKHKSILNVDGKSNRAIEKGVESVISSYSDTDNNYEDQILVQEFIPDVQYSGVVFTCSLETGAPYYRFNFDDKSGATDSITSGLIGDFRTIIVIRDGIKYLAFVEPKLIPLYNAIKEIEEILGFDKLDIEFAVDKSDVIHIFQIRPITVGHSEFEIEKTTINESIQNAFIKYDRFQNKTPFILGSKTFFGNMPDWNPAEIIGIRPKPLAFSLYRSLITNDLWARQRAEFGYRDVRPHYLIHDFCGQPYVDIRASLNSFVPAKLSNQTAEKFIESYLCLLEDKPQLHDKIEFDVAFTMWTPSFKSEALERLSIYGVSENQISELGQALKSITKKAIFRLDEDIKPIQSMIERSSLLEMSPMNPIDKAILLLSDCSRFGALAFAHAARAGFVAISFLKSLVTLGIIKEVDKLAFLRNINTITSEFERDGLAVSNGQLSKEKYIKRYGHLRPGTYDASVEAYWEAPERYLFSGKSNLSKTKKEVDKFKFSKSTRNAIKNEIGKLDKGISYDSFIEYIVDAIQAREYVKFQFTRNLSLALDLIVKYGLELGIGREKIIFLNMNDLEKLKTGELSEINLSDLIEERKRKFAITQMIELPQLLFKESDFYCFERYASQVNFITLKRVEANVILCSGDELVDFQNKIVLIPQADPGCDWLFDHNISGLITKYGGANSHMAIRAAEMNLPAAIGVGEQLYEQLINIDRILLDCANQVVRRV